MLEWSIMMIPFPALVCLSGLALLLGACEARTGRPVRHYVELAPRAVASPDSPVKAATPTPASTPAPAPLAWATPPGWTAEPASGMRLASFKVTGDGGEGTCSIVILAGDGGGLEANLRRWMGQLNLTPPPAEEMKRFLDQQATLSTKGGWTGRLLDLTTLCAPESPSMLAALVDVSGRAVFVKLSGGCAWLKGQQADFRSFCQSLEGGS